VRVPAVSLRTRILLITSALLIALTAATLAYVSVQADQFVNQRLVDDLRRGQELIAAAQADRLARLELAAQVVASFPQLKALLDTADVATVRDFLVEYQQRNQFAQLLIVFDPAGRVIARTDSVTATAVPEAQVRWLQPALGGGVATGLLATERGVFDAAVMPAEAGGTVFGFLLAGAPIEQGYAQALRDISRDDIVLLAANRVLGTTIRDDQLPWKTRQAWDAAHGSAPGPYEVTIGGETYAALATQAVKQPATAATAAEAASARSAAASAPGAPGATPAATPAEAVTIISLQSRDRALAPYRRIQMGLVLLGLIAAAAGVGGSALIARNINAPVARLAEGTRQVAAGNFDFQLNVQRRDELGELARSFNDMTRGLRERADMQKFISQSTVEMIQANPHTARKVSAGERRVMTLFFSDVRGFTTFSEHKPPEEVVRVINRCLSLQAGLVRKFSGDVDKYIGDAVFAHFFGEDMTLRAIRCGLEIHRALDALNAAAPADPPLIVGIGIVTGEAILGSIGSDDRLDYTAIGSNVNLCSRLCNAAAPREILLNEGAYAQVRDLVAAEPTEPLQIKGFSESIRAYRMTARQAS